MPFPLGRIYGNTVRGAAENGKISKVLGSQLMTAVAIIVVIPSLIAFFLSWLVLDDIFQAAIVGGTIHFIAMGFSLKISKKFFTKKRL